MEFVYYDEVEMILDRALKKGSSKRVGFYDRGEAIRYIIKKMHVKTGRKNSEKISKLITIYCNKKGVSLYD